ncbi:MAG TPA: beta-Ala-His dipeptidase, partial [Burkholderiales bacterium]|nr:beta-Ala-His dipeptidase [Burkholderiales bacterium]
MMENDIQNLEPRNLWRHFAKICSIPRSSLHEAELRNHIQDWANSNGIESLVDHAGNLILRKPASKGSESMPGVILQGHLDMVCQADSGTHHDFLKDPIRATVQDGWVMATDTTLGADNGIGVALALAVLEEEGLVHPPLEVLLTVNEESGMDGARGLQPGILEGRMLINLDTEEWGHFYLGCAGGEDLQISGNFELEHVPGNHEIWKLEVSGLRGGHSGIDIHLGRGNAIRLLAEGLDSLSGSDIRVIAIEGGTARNAIPREAHAIISIRKGAKIDQAVAKKNEEWKRRFADVDAGVSLKSTPSASTRKLCVSDWKRMTGFLRNVPDGVAAMSGDFPGVVETSSNLGVAVMEEDALQVTFKVRSLQDRKKALLAEKIASFAESAGFSAERSGAYPGWTPNPSSRLLELLQTVHIGKFGKPASLQVIHAGLEC